MAKGKCVHCGEETNSVPVNFLGLKELPPAEVCFNPKCVEAESESVRKDKDEAWKRTHPLETPVPPLFADTDLQRLPEPLPTIASTWTPDGKGLVIHGTTRKGKTRTAWYLAKRLYDESPYANRFLFLTMFDLEVRLVSAWGTHSWDKEMTKMVNVPLLYLDDLGKEKMTDRMASVLFALIDQRTQNKRSTIITTNLTGDQLLERFHDKETGNAFVARLKDDNLFYRAGVKN
jgi:hypothetical protein